MEAVTLPWKFTDHRTDRFFKVIIVPVAQGLMTPALGNNTGLSDDADGDLSDDNDEALSEGTEEGLFEDTDEDLYEEEDGSAAVTARGTVKDLLTTSGLAFSKKAGYSLETYEKRQKSRVLLDEEKTVFEQMHSYFHTG